MNDANPVTGNTADFGEEDLTDMASLHEIAEELGDMFTDANVRNGASVTIEFATEDDLHNFERMILADPTMLQRVPMTSLHHFFSGEFTLAGVTYRLTYRKKVE